MGKEKYRKRTFGFIVKTDLNMIEKILRDSFGFILTMTIILCLYKCTTSTYTNSSDNDIVTHGDYYDVIKLNDSTYILNPTYRTDSKKIKILAKDSLNYYIK